MSKTELGLYEKLEEILKATETPLTCNDLWGSQEIKDLAESPNRVSDYLGGLWRKGKVSRSPAPRNGSDNSRWAYSWRAGKSSSDMAAPEAVVHYIAGAKSKNILDKPNISITDDGKLITIDLPSLTITIQTKN